MRKATVIVALTLFSTVVFAQQKQQILDYIEQYKQAAIDEMVRAKIPASITLAQGILETGAGTSPLSKNANNHFGIKCKEEWKGGKYYHDDDRPQECFRVYSNARESYTDHSDFLLTRPRYAPLFQLPITAYKYWAYGLKEAGYATNPNYAKILISYIEEYKLYEYDQIGVAMIEGKEKLLAKNETTAKPEVKSHEATVIVSDVKSTTAHHKPIVAETKNTRAREEYVVNGVRAVKAKGNEDPLAIAMEYNIDYSWILLFNDLTTADRFKDGQFIYLQNKKSRGEQATYTVQAGESMHDIAQKTGVKLRDLYYKNSMRPNDQPVAGEIISLQEKTTTAPRSMSYAEFLKRSTTTTSSAPQPKQNNTTAAHNSEAIQRYGNVQHYEVQSSDTLQSIAQKFNTTVEELKQINRLSDTDLREGQRLVVTR